MPNPNTLYNLRKAKGFSRDRLAQLSRVSVRTIQRLEAPMQGSRGPQQNTLERLAKALQVEPEALTGEGQPPDPGDSSASEPRRVQVSAEIAPKARLAYDLVKSRYGVRSTELINMAPLLFTLLAEGSLARRRKILEEAGEAISRLDQMRDEVGYWLFQTATTVALNADMLEETSIAKADLFGEHLLSGSEGPFHFHEPFDPSTDNPFASYLRWLAADLETPGVVEVKHDGLSYGMPWSRLPDYDLCNDELESVTNGSADARRALETGHVRLSEIPEELKGDSAGMERATWLEERLPDIYKGLEEGQPLAEWAKFEATATPTEVKEVLRIAEDLKMDEGLKNAVSGSGSASRNDGGAEEEGDVR